MTEQQAREWLVSPDRPHISSRDTVVRLVGGPKEGYDVMSYDCAGIVYADGSGRYVRAVGSANVLEWQASRK